MIKWPWKEQNSTPIDTLPWQHALAIPLLSSLNEAEQQKLVQLAKRFLQQKHLTPLEGFTLDEIKSARIALLFCLPVLELGIEWLDGFYEVLIYPQPFTVDDEWEDDIGLVHRQQTVHSGQSWHQGPIILNWLDIKDSFDASGFNLIIHEVAHKIDMRNGSYASGIPLTNLHDIPGWEHDLHAAMNHIQDEIDLVGEEASSIDAYAATDPAECFAVLSEYFFSAPQLFTPRFALLYQRFCLFYQQDPMQRLLISQNIVDKSDQIVY